MRSAVCLRCAYGILCKEKRGDSWITVAAVAPFSDGLEAVARLAETCTALGLDYATVEAAFAPLCTKVQPITTAESFDDLS